MKVYEVKIHLEIEAENEKEALKLFWDAVDNTDYRCNPTIEEQEE